MTKKKILVLTDHMPWGHRSIAKAIYGFLKTKEKEENWEVNYAEVKAELGVSNDIYTFICRYLPSTHRIAYKIGEAVVSRERIVREISLKSMPGLKRAIDWYKPDLVISTYFIHSHCLAELREKEKRNFKLWTVVADPRSIVSASYVSKADLNLVYDQVGFLKGIKSGIEKDRILVTGWWVRKEMYQKFNRAEVRKKLGFKDDRPVVFVGGGSLGTNSLTKILPALMLVNKKVGIIFNTGVDKVGYNLVEEYIKLFKKFGNDKVIIKNLGWIENMAEVLSACDIVFGKAGPNFLFDVVAHQIPFVAVTHVGGQEDGNLDLIKEKKLGWIKEKRNLTADFFLQFVDNPNKYLKMYKQGLKREAERNEKTWEIIFNKVKEEL
ncbi:MAG TPA: glycosyltransferase [Candidatus Woesebacteria bacterium]|nr:glycosyltransferase [Candidatus Woesebacteria bacterium]